MARRNYWVIEGMADYGPVRLSKQLLATDTQDAHAEHSRKARTIYRAPSMPFAHALFSSLYLQRNSNPQAEEIRKFLREGMMDGISTLTRLIYAPKGETTDKVIHDYKQTTEKILTGNFVGKNGKIGVIEKGVLLAVLGDDNKKRIAEIYSWINLTPVYFSRINSRAIIPIKTVARFDVNSYRAYLNCYWNPEYSNSSLGVRAVRR
ncbi:hypothetical protein HYV50_05845 [Candidatus Pacearchaeota archaeon]|nr:hypothetical protein [Candidatus Pacearchaeota archaeon]